MRHGQAVHGGASVPVNTPAGTADSDRLLGMEIFAKMRYPATLPPGNVSMQTPLQIARQRLEERGDFPRGAVLDTIAESWKRCLSYGLDPVGAPHDAVVLEEKLAAIKGNSSRVLKIAQPELELLYSQIAGTNFMVAFSDSAGVLLDTIADNDFGATEAGKTIIPGSVWKEEYRGTNALGVALATGKPATVIGREHFFRNHGWVSCLAAPVYDSRNRIVGIVDASSDISARQHHTLALVKLAATNIENHLFLDDHAASLVIAFHPRREYLATMSVGLLALGDDGHLCGANSKGVSMLSGIDYPPSCHFNDIFQTPFGPVMGKLLSGETIRLTDWLGSSVFASAKVTDRNMVSARTHPAVMKAPHPAPAVLSPRQSPPGSDADTHVFDDLLLSHQLKLAQRALGIGLPVLIEGETGSGKSEVARELHRRVFGTRPLYTIDCRSLSEDFPPRALLTGESGQKAKKIRLETGTIADSLSIAGGTFYLDEISAISRSAQRWFTSVVDTILSRSSHHGGGAGLSVICSSSRPINELRQGQRLDAAFYHRVSGYRFCLPRLRERSDFPKLAQALLAEISDTHKLSRSAIDFLQTQEWPGNIRELKKTLQLAIVEAPKTILREHDFKAGEKRLRREVGVCPSCAGKPFKMQRCIIIRRLWNESGNVSLVAKKLGVSRTTVYTHLRN